LICAVVDLPILVLPDGLASRSCKALANDMEVAAQVPHVESPVTPLWALVGRSRSKCGHRLAEAGEEVQQFFHRCSLLGNPA
jgi:hypothetical protein